ncbi:MAG: imidazoleglycerol-phosphate dehydratase HisB [Candidatus Dadabacteria bacterium]|nr:imidazoleglycerol-phosphate dehydratase HisB [Candidatus Dadabacteria bacterium]NIS08963.1 imidazoleglycerol-phosphate dehydratase HisB [Candidatus Dadabacteria bacterium]NIV40778.1 imidazoleglycerol-phosphate dehydratase HisB [Candidatus Dadabacteria bacterium]NIY22270.1 imidazoleglycerol-phosphate dehydratase HisB [Candidatus Dadabacteria bacterium]
MPRKAKVKRKTSEVDVSTEINIDGSGNYQIATGVAFLDHMLEQFSKHGYFDLILKAKGDIEIDYHHTVEDVGITLGDAIGKALGDKKGITRFGQAFVPFDESLVFAAVDLSGRPYCVYNVQTPKSKVGEFDTELAEEFFKSFSNSLKCNLHIELKYGDNLHHIIEATFKAVARALDNATSVDTRSKTIPSTKGIL